MTKAKEALDDFYKLKQKIHPKDKPKPTLEDYGRVVYMNEQTIRKALELLDKVERGGVDTFEMFLDNCNYEEDNYDAGWNHAIAEITEKYILIERDV